MESFFGTLKAELISRTTYATRAVARQDIVSYIEGFYNATRRQAMPDAMRRWPARRRRWVIEAPLTSNEPWLWLNFPSTKSGEYQRIVEYGIPNIGAIGSLRFPYARMLYSFADQTDDQATKVSPHPQLLTKSVLIGDGRYPAHTY